MKAGKQFTGPDPLAHDSRQNSFTPSAYQSHHGAFLDVQSFGIVAMHSETSVLTIRTIFVRRVCAPQL